MKISGINVLIVKWMLVIIAAVFVYDRAKKFVDSYTPNYSTVHVYVQSSLNFTMQCFYDDGRDFNEGQSILKPVSQRMLAQDIDFVVPRYGLRKLRLDFGDREGTFVVKKIVFKDLWLSEDVTHLFNTSNHFIVNKDRGISLQSTGSDPFLISDDLSSYVDRIANARAATLQKSPPFVVAIFVVILVGVLRGWLISYQKPVRFDYILAGCFIALLYIPFFNGLLSLKLDDTTNTENRKLVEKPVFEWSRSRVKTYPADFEKYFNDHFSFRKSLVEFNSYVAVKWLATSFPRVSIGGGGWMYYADPADGDSNTDHQQLLHLSKKQLATIKGNLEEKQRYFDSMNVGFLIVIAPDKQTVYPEHLPAAINVRGRSGTRLDQILHYLDSTKTDVKLLDLRKVMDEHKNDSVELYMQTDTHWNDYGAYLGYREIARELEIQPVGIDNFRIDRSSTKPGDLSDLIAASDWFTESNRLDLVPRTPAPFSATELDQGYYPGKIYYGKPLRITNTSGTNLPKALIFRDSFAISLLKFLPYHFSETTCIWICELDKDIVEKEKPQVVIMEILERYATCLERE